MLSPTAIVTHHSNQAVYADSLFGASSGTLSYACQQVTNYRDLDERFARLDTGHIKDRVENAAEPSARMFLGGLAYFMPHLKQIWVDAAYRGKELATWRRQLGADWELEIVEREPDARGFSVQPRKWVVEHSFAWLTRNRRLAKDYERRAQICESLIELAMIRLLLRRLGRCACWAERHRLASGATSVAPSQARSSSSPPYDSTGNGGPSHSMP